MNRVHGWLGDFCHLAVPFSVNFLVAEGNRLGVTSTAKKIIYQSLLPRGCQEP